MFSRLYDVFTGEKRRGRGCGIPRRPELAADERCAGDDVQGDHDDRLFHGVDQRLGDEWVAISQREIRLTGPLEVDHSRYLIARPYRDAYPRVGVHQHDEGQQELRHAVPAIKSAL